MLCNLWSRSDRIIIKVSIISKRITKSKLTFDICPEEAAWKTKRCYISGPSTIHRLSIPGDRRTVERKVSIVRFLINICVFKFLFIISNSLSPLIEDFHSQCWEAWCRLHWTLLWTGRCWQQTHWRYWKQSDRGLSRDIPHLADEESGQSEKSQEGLPSASVSKSCMERSNRVCLKIQTGYLD